VAALGGRKPPFARSSEALLAAMRAFEVTYARLDEYQRGMEQYWCLRSLEQEGLEEVEAEVVRENIVHVLGMPLHARVPSLPGLAPGARVRLAIEGIDLLERTVALAYRQTLAAGGGASAPGGEQDAR
jgi:exoribonuclease-2